MCTENATRMDSNNWNRKARKYVLCLKCMNFTLIHAYIENLNKPNKAAILQYMKSH